MPEFFQTALGRRFYEYTLPELVRQLARLNELLGRLVEREDTRTPQPPVPEGESP